MSVGRQSISVCNHFIIPHKNVFLLQFKHEEPTFPGINPFLPGLRTAKKQPED